LEVLIATFILALVIILINFSSKQFFSMQVKMQRMENIYLSTLSMKDRLEHTPLTAGAKFSGRINGLDYQYTVNLVAEKNNYLYGLESERGEGVGSFRMKLLRVELQMAGRVYEFYTTQHQ